MDMKFKKKLKNEQEFIIFCEKYLEQVSILKSKNIKKSGSINSKEHDEFFTFFSFMHYSINKPFWAYPITIEYNDRPDFIIEYSDKKVSIEVTGQKANEWRYAMDKAEKLDTELGDTYFEGIGIEKSKIKYTDAEIKQKDNCSPPPSMGNNAEICWVERTKYTIIEKNKKAKKYPSVNSFSNHILLIFDLRPELIIPDALSERIFNNADFYQQCGKTLFERVVCIDGDIIDIDLNNKSFKCCGKNKAVSLIQNKKIAANNKDLSL